MSKLYEFKDGVYTFPAEQHQVQLSRVNRDRHGNIFAQVQVLTVDGSAYLALDTGNLSSSRFRSGLATQAASRNSGNPLPVDNTLLDILLALENDPAISISAPPPNFIPIQQFAESVPPPGDPVVEGLMERGKLYGLSSKPKSGKSILLLNLSIACTQGYEWLGRKVSPGTVFFIQLEDASRTLMDRITRMTGNQLPLGLHFHVDPFRLVPENYEMTVEQCAGASLIICDPIVQASSVRDWNDTTEVRAAYDLWRTLARDTGAAVIIAAHNRKMDGDFGDALAGSGQAFATVDGLLELNRDKKLKRTERRLSYVGRDWPDLNDDVIDLDPLTLSWTVSGTYSEIRDMDDESRLQSKTLGILELLPNEPPGLTYRELGEKSEFSRRQLRDIVEALGDKIARQGNENGSRTNPLRFWRVDESEGGA